MRALAGVLVVLAVGLGACGGVGPVTDADPANDAVVPTPVPGAPGVSAPPAPLTGAVGPTPAINPDRVGAAVPIGAGDAPTGRWGGWVYRLKDGTMCIEYVGGNSGGAACGPERSMLEPTTSTSDRDGFVSGGTSQPTAVGAVVRLADGSTTNVPLVSPGDLSAIGARYYVAAIPVASSTVTVDIVDAAGTVLETSTLTVR